MAGRVQLGVSPDHEIAWAVDVDQHRTRRIFTLRRGQEATAAQTWPIGTPLTWLSDHLWPGSLLSEEQLVLNLTRPLPAAATKVDLRHVYRRAKIDSEILWVTGRDGYTGETLNVQRGREGTTAATHAADAPLTWLAAGAS